ncbi:monooxygenase [Diplocarpon mali]|nr:monooxygenase [Diplocarpon mali]
MGPSVVAADLPVPEPVGRFLEAHQDSVPARHPDRRRQPGSTACRTPCRRWRTRPRDWSRQRPRAGKPIRNPREAWRREGGRGPTRAIPTDASALVPTRARPGSMAMVGVYVVNGLQANVITAMGQGSGRGQRGARGLLCTARGTEALGSPVGRGSIVFLLLRSGQLDFGARQSANAHQNVVVVGASVSGMDISIDFVGHAPSPLSKTHPEISRVDGENGARAVQFRGGRAVDDVDCSLFGTGFAWSSPFLPDVRLRSSLRAGSVTACVAAPGPTKPVAAGLTLNVDEWQAVQDKWESDRRAYRGDGVPFTALYPDLEQSFKTLRERPGEPAAEFERELLRISERGHSRMDVWMRGQASARSEKSLADTAFLPETPQQRMNGPTNKMVSPLGGKSDPAKQCTRPFPDRRPCLGAPKTPVPTDAHTLDWGEPTATQSS